MILLPWSEDFETGIEVIDNEHRRLFEIINVFAVISKIRINTMDIIDFIDELEKYSLEHFKTEEYYMKEKGYPLLEYHKKFHDELKLNLDEAKKLLKKNELEEPLETIITYARDWLSTHVGKEDQSFAYFCKNKEKNSRKVVNVAIQIGATMIYDNRSFLVELINMSLEGLLIETDEALRLKENISVIFIMQNKRIVLPCKLETKKEERKYTCKFKELLDWQEDLIFSYVLDRQRINMTLSKTDR